MITFKLEDKATEAMMAVLNAGSPNASFVEELNAQYIKQTQVKVVATPEPEPEPDPEVETEVEEKAEPEQE
jgi:hypothetical protein